MSENTSRMKELRSALEAKQASIREGAKHGINIDGNNVEVKADDYAKLQNDFKDVESIKMAIKAEAGFDQEMKSFFEAPTSGSAAMQFNAGMQTPQAKSLGELFTESQEFKDFLSAGTASMNREFELKAHDITAMGTYGQKDVFTASGPALTNRGFGATQRDPMVPRGQRTARVRDLFPAASTSANLIEFFRVMGFVENGGDGNAQTVAERTGTEGTDAVFGLKPKSNLKFNSAQASVRTIAHWEAAHRNILADEPQLQSTINNELLYGLALEEDDQILNGDGNNENLLGILNTPDIQVYTQDAQDRKSDALRRAATLSVIANFPGTGFVLHPFDWEDIELQKAQGDGQYMLVSNVAVGATTQIWRQPVIETPAMHEGTFLTGAWGVGAQLYDRQVASVRIAEQHSDFFVRNAVAILAEERLALAVKRPESFVKGTFVD